MGQTLPPSPADPSNPIDDATLRDQVRSAAQHRMEGSADTMLDVEVLQVLAESMQSVVVDDATLAVDAIDDVGPGGHFFGTAHTLERFETAFHDPIVFTRQNFGQWTDAGAQDAAARATGVWQQWLRDFEEPAMDADARSAVEEFVARRVAEGGAHPES